MPPACMLKASEQLENNKLQLPPPAFARSLATRLRQRFSVLLSPLASGDDGHRDMGGLLGGTKQLNMDNYSEAAALVPTGTRSSTTNKKVPPRRRGACMQEHVYTGKKRCMFHSEPSPCLLLASATAEGGGGVQRHLTGGKPCLRSCNGRVFTPEGLHCLLQFLQQNLVEQDVVLVRKRIVTCNRPATNTFKRSR